VKPEQIPKPSGSKKVLLESAHNPARPDACQYYERRRTISQSKLRPYIDIAKIMVLIAMAHLILKLVANFGEAIKEVKRQTDVIIDIRDHIHNNDESTNGK
jgi:hypothetical protein